MVPDSVAEAVELAEEFVREGGELGAQVSKNAASIVYTSEGPGMLTRSANLKKAREEAANAKVKLDTLLSAAEMAEGEHKVALGIIRE